MAAFKHGVYTSEQSTSLATSVPVESGVTFAVGTAPVYMTDGKVNKVIYTQSLKEAVGALGNSSDFESFTLCEVINTHYTLYGVSPVVFVNVFDPAKHKSAVTEAEYTLIDGRVELPESAIIGSVVVKTTAGGTALVSVQTITRFTRMNIWLSRKSMMALLWVLRSLSNMTRRISLRLRKLISSVVWTSIQAKRAVWS